MASLLCACSSASPPGGGSGTSDCVTATDDVIATFNTDNGIEPVDGRSGGFYVYGDMVGSFDPPETTSPYPIDAASGNPTCSGPGSFHVKASGLAKWGGAAAVDFMPQVDIGGMMYKGTYDASKYKGISFWAKGAAPVMHVLVSFPDVYTDGGANPTPLDPTTSSCVYAAGAPNNCSPYLVKFGDPDWPMYGDVQIDTTWKRFDVYFADTKQDPYNMGFHRSNANIIDTQHLTGMAIQVNANYDASGTPSANDFEMWIDDVAFIK